MQTTITTFLLVILSSLLISTDCSGQKDKKTVKITKKELFFPLSKEEERVIMQKGTEKPFSGKFYQHNEKGTYICKRCGLPLYHSNDKFDSDCGWPSFDAEIPGAIKRDQDADGVRIEIMCAYCLAHLGHVFKGERFTAKNIRHCVNSISLNFVKFNEPPLRNRAFFAGGCFWGVEYLFENKDGVLDVRSGYMGDDLKNPTYKLVSSGKTNFAETVEIIYKPSQISYEELVKLFFEIHDFTQLNRQGPDIGPQYRSEIFYTDEHQRKSAKKILAILKEKKFAVKTKLSSAKTFWPAEDYHQDYFAKSGGQPTCHIYKKIFD